MAELTATDATAYFCCAPERQATCCEPSAKADCCGHEEGCGCAAGTPDVRERYAAVRVATTDPGAGLIDVEIRKTHRVHPQAASVIRAGKPSGHPA